MKIPENRQAENQKKHLKNERNRAKNNFPDKKLKKKAKKDSSTPRDLPKSNIQRWIKLPPGSDFRFKCGICGEPCPSKKAVLDHLLMKHDH